jgi:hypothetical protein
VAYQSRDLCGASELRFDGSSVAHQLTGITEPPDLAWIGMFMTLEIPVTANAGIHDIELFLPLNEEGRGPVFGNEPQRVSRLASTHVTIQV